MRVYTREDGHYFCGHWNGSPLEIGDSTLLRSVPESETRHFHEYFEYCIALEDPSGLFNSSLDGNTRRAIDFREGEKIDEKALKALIRAAVALNVSRR